MRRAVCFELSSGVLMVLTDLMKELNCIGRGICSGGVSIRALEVRAVALGFCFGLVHRWIIDNSNETTSGALDGAF